MIDLSTTGYCQFTNVRFESTPESEKRFKWLMDNRELIEFCIDAGLPIPRYQSSTGTTNLEEKI